MFHWAVTEGLKTESGGGVLGWRQQPPLHQLGGLGKRCELPSAVLGRAPTAQRFSTIFSTQDGLY